MQPAFELGPFRLHRQIGRGASATVWYGEHALTGTPVAVKVIHSDAANARVLSAFRDEVRAVARLDHPGVVLVFEQGIVSPRDAEASDGALEAGAPWLAMEHAARGTLERLDEVLAWKDLRGILLALLAALAHAHARGVLHRDVKPANVLLGHVSDLRPAVRLADFGLAWALGRESDAARVCGSPAYMAPEQFDGRWRAFGPATDLYAVGCVAWTLATGAPLYEGATVSRVASQHCHAPLPPFAPRGAVPADFEAWLARALAKDPQARFQWAADAAHALRALGESTAGSAGVAPPPRRAASPSDTLMLETLDRLDADEALIGVALSSSDATTPLTSAPPPAPPSWRGPATSFRVPELRGAGLSLWGLRSAPLVGRDVELDRVWSALLEVHRSHDVRVVVLEGEPGSGKSRIAREIAERAAESGAAIVLKATHGPTPGAADGIPGMLARRFSVAGLDADALAAHLTLEVARLPGLTDADAPTIAAVIRGTATETARRASARRVLRAIAVERPVVLWIDDGQWGADAVSFVDWLRSGADGAAFPLLALVTRHARVEDPDARAALAALAEGPRTTRLPVGPLEDAHAEALARRMLGVSDGLARRAASATAGNPLHLLQLLGSWVAAGALVSGGDGLEVPAALVPTSLSDTLEARLRLATAGFPPPLRRLLELAATLGDRVRTDEWDAVAAALGLEGAREVRDALYAQRLAIPEPGGWSFTHGLLRDAVLAGAQGAPALHSAVADVLRDRAAEPTRVAAHLAAAGRDAEALDLTIAAATRLADAGATAEAFDALERAEGLLGRLGLPDDDPRRAGWQAARAMALFHRGDLRGANDAAQRAVEVAGRSGDVPARTDAALVLAATLRALGRLDEAAGAVDVALDEGDAVTRARGLLERGRTAVIRGRLDEAEVDLAAARDAASLAGAPHVAAEALGRLGDVWRQRGDQDRAAQHFAAAAAMHRAMGDLVAESTQLHGLAEADRLSGRLDAAEAGYRHCITLLDALGRDAEVARFNLGLCLIARESSATAAALMRALIEEWSRADRVDLLGAAWAGLLCAASQLGDPREADRARAALEPVLAGGVVDIDFAMLCGTAAEAWARHGDPARHEACERLAIQQRRALGL